jgi:hypothetical protein
VEHGDQLGGWAAWGGSIVEDDGLIAVFGACTLP